jgi:hypothetical protein
LTNGWNDDIFILTNDELSVNYASGTKTRSALHLPCSKKPILTGGTMRLKLSYLVVTVAMLFCLSLSLERRAYAYVDPGSGLLILQGVGTVLTGVLFTLRRRIKALFTRSRTTEPVPSSGAPSAKV